MEPYYSIIKQFNKKSILVIGDAIVDVYLQGTCSRIAPEASIPIVDLKFKKKCLGGAANVAANLSAMGANVMFCSVTGDDDGFNSLKELLEAAGISTRLLLPERTRQTLIKTRISSNSHTLARYDEGTTGDISPELVDKLEAEIETAHELCDAILIADYNKGVINNGILEVIGKLQQKKKKFLAVDSKKLERFAFLKPDLVTPNYVEALSLIGVKNEEIDRTIHIQQQQATIYEKTQAGICVVTLDSEGACFLKNNNSMFQLVATRSLRPHVCGAGDTFISACLLALMANASLKIAGEIAMEAAFIAVQKEGTAICLAEEILAKFKLSDKVQARNISALCDVYRAEGKRIVFTNGCFDVLHSGHVSYLKGAKEKGDVLIVGLNKDESVTRLKGQGRPINTFEHRMAVLSELNCVDQVIPFGDDRNDTPIDLIKKIKPHVFVKGADYKHKLMPELKILKEIGAEIVLIPLTEDQSTTGIIARIKASMNNKIAIKV